MSREEPIPFRPANRTLDEVAADWFGRRDGGLTRAEEQELRSWLDADPRHARAFARLAATSDALSQLSAYRPPSSAKPDPDLPLLRAGRPVRTGTRRARWVAVTLAAAAALTFASTLGWRSYSLRPSYTEAAATDVGGLRKLVLPDASVIELNTDSAVDVAFSRRERRVTLLRGEAHFNVAKDAARPFTVSVNNIAVRAVGTAFNVRLRTGNVDVLVTEGRVRLNDLTRGDSLLPSGPTAAEPSVLVAGHRALVRTDSSEKSAGPSPAVVTPVAEKDISRELAWQQKRLEFGPTPLAVVVAEFNRYNRHQLVLADAELGSLSVGGSFEATGHETLVRLLESSFGITAERRDHETILRRR
jgi:transmembrane sensor